MLVCVTRLVSSVGQVADCLGRWKNIVILWLWDGGVLVCFLWTWFLSYLMLWGVTRGTDARVDGGEVLMDGAN